MRGKKSAIFLLSILLFLYVYLYFLHDVIFLRNKSLHDLPKSKLQNFSRDVNYLVNTSHCKIEDANPFDPTIISAIQQPIVQICDEPMVNVNNKIITINDRHPKYDSATCCYREIHRVTVRDFKTWIEADWSNQYSECTLIPKSKEGIEMSSEFIRAECIFVENGTLGSWADFFATAFSPLEHSKNTTEKYKYWKDQRSTQAFHMPPNVLTIGIDSVSRLHMIRFLPETRKFLKDHDFIEMKGYTKIGENTFPNVMAILGGMIADNNNYYSCWTTNFDSLDSCPLIWKNFSQHKYITAFLEETASYGSLNFLKTGFVEQPTDYYLRPITAAYHGDLDVAQAYRGCVSGTNQSDFAMKYTRETIQAINNESPYFIHFWLTTLAHDDFNAYLQMADFALKSNLEKLLESEGNNTVMFFLSDHGYRYGTYRQTFVGYYEESLPFSFIRLPPSLKEKFPHWYTNLLVNSARLTSPLDLHATLEDILSLSSINPTKFSYTHQNWEPQFRSVYSFFEETPLNRTCESSGILKQHCRCDSFSKEPVDWTYFQANMSHHLAEKINDILVEQISKNICAKLFFKKFVYIRQLIMTSDIESILGKDFVLTFDVAPNGARYEIRCRVYEDGTFKLFGYFNRINSYDDGLLSNCVTDPNIRRYCSCVQLLP